MLRSITRLVASALTAASLTLVAAGAAQAALFIPAPTAPGSVRAVVMSASSVQVNWVDRSTNETRFIVRLNRSDHVFDFNGAAVAGTGTRTALNLTDIAPGAYVTTVCAVLPSETQCGMHTTFTVGPPPSANTATAPSQLSFTRVGAGTARISWAHAGGAASFLVYVASPDHPVSMLAATVAGSERQADVFPLLAGVSYRVQVCATASGATGLSCSAQLNVAFPLGF